MTNTDYSKQDIKQHNFDKWIPAEVKVQLIKFWGIFGRTTKDWLEAAKDEEAEECSHVPYDGFMHPPYGARVEYIVESHRGEETKFITGRYIYMWGNMGRLVTDEGIIICVSTCDRWVRIYSSRETIPLYLTIIQVAKRYNASIDWVRKAVREGYFPPARIFSPKLHRWNIKRLVAFDENGSF